MCRRKFAILVFLIGCVFLSGCSITPVVTKEDTARTATAKRFLHNVGAGELAMTAFVKELENQANEQPGMTELIKRAFTNINQEDFENLAAEVYSRHLTHEDLMEIATFSEKPAIQRLFKVIFGGISSGKQLDNQELLRQFSADELTEIMKMSLSDSLVRMKEVLPEINKELVQASNSLRQEILRDYLISQ